MKLWMIPAALVLGVLAVVAWAARHLVGIDRAMRSEDD